MRVGYFPCTQDPPNGDNVAVMTDDIIEQAKVCESVGFDGFFFTEHLQQKDAYSPAPGLERAGRMIDAWIANPIQSVEGIKHYADLYRAEAKKNGGSHVRDRREGSTDRRHPRTMFRATRNVVGNCTSRFSDAAYAPTGRTAVNRSAQGYSPIRRERH